MKALVCEEFGNVDSLRISEVESKHLEENEVRIKVEVCALNFPDLLIFEKKYQFLPELPYIPGGEAVGVIVEKGSGVKEFEIGQKVFMIERWGMLSEEIVLPKERVNVFPNEIKFNDAASLVYNASTALYALKNRGNAQSGETLLVLGTGGVALAAIQLANAMGLKVFVAGNSNEALEKCKVLGASETLNFNEENIKLKLNDWTDKKGVDLVLDTVGGAHSELAVRSLAWGGRFLVVGFVSGEIPKIPLNLLLLKGADIRGVFWGKFSREEPEIQNENMKDILRFIKEGKLKSYIGAKYVFEEAKQAFVDYKSRKTKGKVIIKFQ